MNPDNETNEELMIDDDDNEFDPEADGSQMEDDDSGDELADHYKDKVDL